MNEVRGTFWFKKETVNFHRFDLYFGEWGNGFFYLPRGCIYLTKGFVPVPDCFVFERGERRK